jgi:hypothetical protein
MSALTVAAVTDHSFVSHRMCKVFENRSLQDEERMDQLTNQLKEARLLAEDADGKSDEVTAACVTHYSCS